MGLQGLIILIFLIDVKGILLKSRFAKEVVDTTYFH